MYDNIVENYIETLNESWDYEPSTLFIHLVDIKLNYEWKPLIGSKKIIFKPSDKIFTYSFIGPSGKRVMSMVTNKLAKGNVESIAYPTFTKLSDPADRFDSTQLDVESSSELIRLLKKPIFGVEEILGIKPNSNDPIALKKLLEIPCEIITTHVPIPTPFGIGFSTFVWQNVRLRIDKKNKLNLHSLKFQRLSFVNITPGVSAYEFEMTSNEED